MPHFVYVLQSKKDNNLYIGYTKNIKLRFEQHQKGKINSTKDRRPLKLIYFECCSKQKDATHRERYLKTYYGHKFIKSRLKSYFTG
jgi:putative endonuclease